MITRFEAKQMTCPYMDPSGRACHHSCHYWKDTIFEGKICQKFDTCDLKCKARCSICISRYGTCTNRS